MAFVVVGGLAGYALGGTLGAAALGAGAGALLGGGLGGGGPDIDMSGQNAAALQQANISQAQLDFAKSEADKAGARQAQFDPKFLALLDQAMKSQATQDQRSAQQWDTYTTTFLPAEKRLAELSLNYDTPGRRNEAAGAARAQIGLEGAQQRDAQGRALNRAGVSLSSGRSLTLDNASRLTEAKASAGADQNARRQVETTGLSLLDNAAKFGRNLPSTGLQAASLAQQAGNSASGTLGQQQGTYNASLAPAVGLYGNASASAQAAGSQYNAINGIGLQQQANDNAGMAGLGSLVGQLGSAYLLSDPKTKKVHGKVDGKRALRSLEDAEVKDWTYKKGHGDEGRHLGRMAGKDDPIGLDGLRRIDVASELGLHHAAVGELSKKVKKLERRLSLADVEDARKVRRSA